MLKYLGISFQPERVFPIIQNILNVLAELLYLMIHSSFQCNWKYDEEECINAFINGMTSF